MTKILESILKNMKIKMISSGAIDIYPKEIDIEYSDKEINIKIDNAEIWIYKIKNIRIDDRSLIIITRSNEIMFEFE